MTDYLDGLPDDADVYAVTLAFDRALDAEPNDHTLLRRWTARFPQFADELAAVGYARLAFGLTLSDPVAEYSASPALQAGSPPLASLTQEAERVGLTPAQLAARLRLDTPLLARLNQRLLDAGTLPRALVRQLADALDRSTEEVAAYLRLPPRLAAGAQYKASQTPIVRETGTKPSFADALGRLPQADRDYWRSEMENEGTLGGEEPTG